MYHKSEREKSISRFINPVPQYKPFSKLFFFDSGTNTQLTTYKDSAEKIANSHPVLTDSAGFVPNIFFTGTAKLVVEDGDDVQYIERDPVGGENELGSFSLWSPLVTYSINNIVEGSDGKFYQSSSSGNINNDPVSGPTAWFEIRFIEVWNTNSSYSIGDIVQTTEGNLWRSTANTNIGNDPLPDDGTNWSAAALPKTLTDSGEPRAIANNTGVLIIGDIKADNFAGKNYIINGGFDIFQRGNPITSAAEYMADRWFTTWSIGMVSMTMTQETMTGSEPFSASNFANFASVDPTLGNFVVINQRVEVSASEVNGRDFAVSFWYKTPTSTAPVVVSVLGGGTGTITPTNTWQKHTGTAAITGQSDNPIGIQLQINGGVGAVDLDIANVQVEPGKIETEFQYLPKATTLSLCQRYFQTFTYALSEVAASGMSETTVKGRIPFFLGNPMRTPASVIFVNNWAVRSISTGLSPATAPTAVAYPSNIQITVNNVSQTVGQALAFVSNSSASRIDVDAEL